MRKLLIGLLAAASLVGVGQALAQSADAPTGSGVDWNGFYAGVFGGYALDRQAAGGGSYGPLDQGSQSIELSGASTRINAPFGGIQAGYNYQHGIVVVGGEFDLGMGGLSKSATGHLGVVNNDPLDPGTFDIMTKATYSIGPIATLRGRIGLEVPEGIIFYLTGGIAVAERTTTSDTDGTSTLGLASYGSGSFSSKSSQIVYGPVFGGGVEAMVTDHVSLAAEYSYVNLPDADNTADVLSGYLNTTSEPFAGGFHQLKASVRYHF